MADALALVRVRLEQLLEAFVVVLMVALTFVIVIGFSSRLAGNSFSWTGEIAENGLAWLTFYGSALAAAKGAHISAPNIINMLPPVLRVPMVIVAEILTLGFFGLFGWMGLKVFVVLNGSTLVSLPWISQQLTESAVPITSALFIVAELLRFPQILGDARGRGFGVEPESQAMDAQITEVEKDGLTAAVPLREER